MVQCSRRSRFQLEALQALRITRPICRQDLDGHVTFQLCVAGTITSPIPPEPTKETISYSPSLVPLISAAGGVGGDCRKLDRAFSSDDKRDSTSLRSDISFAHAPPRNWERLSVSNSSTWPSTSRTLSHRSGVMRVGLDISRCNQRR